MGKDDLDHDVYIMMYKGFEDIRASTADRNEFWNFYPTLKEACKLFWMEKGHFNCTIETILDSRNSYFKRAWYNEEAYVHMKGFEEAFLEMLKENYLQSR